MTTPLNRTISSEARRRQHWQNLRGNAEQETAQEPVLSDPGFSTVTALLVVHFVLAYVMKQSPIVSTVHSLLTLAIGLYALTRKDRPELLAYVLAYIAGVELIWRGGGSRLFYEIGKYSLIGFSMLGVLLQESRLRSSKWGLIFAALLLPSLSVLPFFDRQLIAFNLVGPVALGFACFYFSTVKLNLPQFKRLLLAMLIPAASLGFLALFFTVTTSSIDFTGGSIRATSAGIGSNQVSSILGLAAICSYSYALIEKRIASLRWMMIIITFVMLAQAMLTFSRGGLWTGVAAILISAILLLRNPRARMTVLISALILTPIFIYFIFPAIDGFTGNALSARLEDSDLTNRDLLMRIDLKLFQENPVFGVGPGYSEVLHSLYLRSANTHTEYTRLLAEHGYFGVAALLILTLVTFNRIFRKQKIFEGSFGVMFTAWALLFMAHSATRLVAVALVFALPEMTLDIDEPVSAATEKKELSRRYQRIYGLGSLK